MHEPELLEILGALIIFIVGTIIAGGVTFVFFKMTTADRSDFLDTFFNDYASIGANAWGCLIILFYGCIFLILEIIVIILTLAGLGS